MSAGAPWSVKGIDPKAREIAKDLARRSGMTLGEWLNQMILEDGGDEESVTVGPFGRRQAPYGGPNRRGRLRRLEDAYADRERARAVPSSREDDDLAGVTEALEALSARLEAAENRTTLAVSGVDQAVSGLLARLENAEREQLVTADRLERVADDLRDGQGRMVDRLRDLERDSSGPRSVEALRALEGALGKIATQVLDADTRTRADIADLSRRIERAETERRDPDSRELIDGVVARIGERLEQAEARTSGAIRTLESSLGHLDDRLRGAESRLDADRETRFEKLAGDLSQRVEEARSELVRRFDAAADSRFDQVDRGLAELTGHVQAAEQSSAQAIERMGHEVLRIAQNLNRRMTGVERSSATAVERVGGEMARVAHAVEDRLRKQDDQQVQALEKLGQEIARISERLTERVAHSERRSALTADDVGERIGRVADKLEAKYERASGELAERIRMSEERTARLLAEARETIDRSLARADERAQAPEPPPAPVVRPQPQAFEAQRPAFPQQEPFPQPPAPPAFEPAPEAIFEAPPPFAAFAELDRGAPLETAEPPIDEFFAPPEPSLASAPPPPSTFDDFSGDTEFMSPQEVRAARPAVSTKEAIEAARAAARLGVRNSAETNSSPLFGGRKKNKLNERVEKESKREGSTVKKALLASSVAMVLASSGVGYWLLVQDDGRHHGQPGGLKVLAGDLFKGGADADRAPLAAVAYAQPTGPLAVGDQSQAEGLYQTAVAHIADGKTDGVTELSRAANLGYAPAQFFLASLYTSGESGVRKDPTEARRWTERAALGGDRRAMFNLGMFFFDGTGGPKDETEAANWFRKAADLGLVDSQYNLARLYEQGLGVKHDPVEAYKWYLIAGRAGDEQSKNAAAQIRNTLDDDDRQNAEHAAAAFKPAETDSSAG
jgi:localization factor PodJL